MSLKTKIQALITAANAKTGKSDTDLTTAVQSLISGTGGITPSGNKAITATTTTLTDIDVTNYATVSVAPTPSEALFAITNGDVTPSSGKLLSMVTVDVPTGPARTSSDLTVSGATVNVPAGLYSSVASKSVASGTAGTPTASKGAVSNNSVTVTPSVTNTAGYITGGTKTGTGVTVSASELVSGNKAVTPSETAQTGIDVTNFATVSVDAITPSIVGNLDASSFAASIVAALASKGVAVPAGTKISGLATLIESIQTSGGSVDQISFSLQISQGGQISDYGTFTATSGTTWADWIGSSYTFDDGLVLIIDGNGHVVNSEGIYELQYNGATVNGSDQIISGATYTLFNTYG